MHTVNVRQVRNAFPKVLRSLRSGESIEVTNRGKVVAVLQPPAKPYDPAALAREIDAAHDPKTRKRRAKIDAGRFMEENR